MNANSVHDAVPSFACLYFKLSMKLSAQSQAMASASATQELAKMQRPGEAARKEGAGKTRRGGRSHNRQKRAAHVKEMLEFAEHCFCAEPDVSCIAE